MRLVRTDSDNKDFRNLVRALDSYLKVVDGEDHSFYAQFNKIDSLKYAVVAYDEDMPVGCGAIKPYDGDTMEIKRMFVPLDARGKGIATKVLKELETWAMELHYERCILETGKAQTDAVRLYQKNHYYVIPNFGQYANIEASVCFAKILS